MNPFPFIILIILSIYLSMVYTLFEFDSKNDKTDSILTCISFYLMMIIFYSPNTFVISENTLSIAWSPFTVASTPAFS